MKARVIVGAAAGVLAVIIVATAVGNWYVGRMAEKALSLEIYRRTSDRGSGLTVSYDDIDVNPLLRRVQMKEFELGRRSEHTLVHLESVTVTCKLADLISLARKGQVEELHGVGLEVSGFSLAVERIGQAVVLDRAKLQVDGLLSRRLYERGSQDLLENKRRIRFEAEGAKAPVVMIGFLPLPPELLEAISEADQVSLDVSFDPDKGSLEIGEVDVKSDLLDLQLAGEVLLGRAATMNPDVERLKADLKLRVSPEEHVWPLPAMGEQCRLSVSEVALDAKMDWEHTPAERVRMPKGQVSLSASDLALRLGPEAANQPMLVPLRDFNVSEIKVEARCDGEVLKVTTARLRSPEANVDGELEVDFQGADIGDGVIRKARLQATDMCEELTSIIAALEETMGTRILDHNAIDVQWRGTLDNPVFAGSRGNRQ
jgi:hypothetical protein